MYLNTLIHWYKEWHEGGDDDIMSTLPPSLCLSLSSGADTTAFAVQAEVTLKTNFFATRDMLTHFLPIVKAGGKDTELHQVSCPPLLS